MRGRIEGCRNLHIKDGGRRGQSEVPRRADAKSQSTTNTSGERRRGGGTRQNKIDSCLHGRLENDGVLSTSGVYVVDNSESPQRELDQRCDNQWRFPGLASPQSSDQVLHGFHPVSPRQGPCHTFEVADTRGGGRRAIQRLRNLRFSRPSCSQWASLLSRFIGVDGRQLAAEI
jgi:hypothetical protein